MIPARLRPFPVPGLLLLLAAGPLAAQAGKPQGGGGTPATIPQRVAALLGGSALAAQPGGAPAATLEVPLKAQVVERRNGWSKVRLELWVRDDALGDSLPSSAITGADLRAQPDKYVGRTVEWTLQSIGVATADELRPEMPAGQPYLLARGPLPETGFVYLMLPQDQVQVFRELPPLSRLRVRATIHAGKSRFLSTPILDLVRRLTDTTESQ